jgi:hypothetical protein
VAAAVAESTDFWCVSRRSSELGMLADSDLATTFWGQRNDDY